MIVSVVGLNASSPLSVNEDYLMKTSSSSSTLPAFNRLPAAFANTAHRASPYSPGTGTVSTSGYGSDPWPSHYATADPTGTLQYGVMTSSANRNNRNGPSSITSLSAAASLSASKSLNLFVINHYSFNSLRFLLRT